MRIVAATPFLSKNTAFPTTCRECTSKLELFPTDVFVDVHEDGGERMLHPLFQCPVCGAMTEILDPVIPQRVRELWLRDQPV